MTSRQQKAMTEMAKILARAPRRFERLVQKFFDDPKAALAAAGVDMKPNDAKAPWILLLDALVEAGQIASVDWKEDAEEVMASLDADGARRVRGDRRRWAWTKGLDLDKIRTADFLHDAGVQLAKQGLELLSLDDSSDAYALVLLERDAARRLVVLADSAGFSECVKLPASDKAHARVGKVKKKRVSGTKRRSRRTRDEIYPWTNLESIKGTAKKFWGARVYPRALQTTWGRIGTSGRGKWAYFLRDGLSARAAEEAIARKLREGYKRALWRPADFENK